MGLAAPDAQRDPPAVGGPEPDTTAHGFVYHAALDGLRAIAVLAVIAYHDQYSWAKGGFLGVDLFFVLSGFLITTLLVKEFRRGSTIALGAFWARRARRLLPALLLVLVFVALYTHLAVVPWERNGVRDDMFASLFYVANWRFIFDQQGYFQLFAAASPLRHMWSLAIEEQYYLVWPLVVLGCLRLGRGSTRVLGAVCAVGAGASVIDMWLRFHPGDPSGAYYATDARAHSLLVGAFLAIVLVAWRPSARACRALALGAIPAFVIVLVAAHITSGTGAHYYHGGSVLFAIVVAILIAGVLQAGPLTALLSVRPLAWIGRISYGLYLWHWPIDVWLVPSRVHVGTTTLNALRLGVTFAASIASYYLVERPIRERRWSPRVSLAAFAPVAAIMVVVITASAVGASGPPGFIWGYGDPLVCGTPRPSETRAAITAEARSGPLSLPASVRGQHILLVGDSTACSLWPGLNAVGDDAGIATDKGSVFGCGVASGEITTTRNEAITPHSSRCPALVDTTETAALARSRPNIVIWMSIWEKSDLVVDGHTVVAGTPAGEKEIMARMDAALARLTAGGAHVALVTEAAPAPNPAQGTLTTSTQADNDGYVRLNALLRRFQARHPNTVSIVDLAAKLCPAGPPCPETVDGLHAASRRPSLHAGRGRPTSRALDPRADLRDGEVTTDTVVVSTDDEPPSGEPPTNTSDAPGRSRWHRLALAAPAYLPAVMIAAGGWQHRWMDEDAFINLRIVDQIFAGHGPVFNAGERVEAATSTLWLAVLVVGRAIFGSFASMEWITLLASLAAAVGAFVVAGKATRLLHRGEAGVVVPVGLILVASVAVVWDFSTSGLEMGLVWLWIGASWFVLVAAAAHARDQRPPPVRLRRDPRSRAARAPRPRADDALPRGRVVRARAAATHRVRPHRDPRAPRRVPDLPHGLLRHDRARRPRSPRTRADCTSARGGRTRRTSSVPTGSGSPRSSSSATIVYGFLADRDRRMAIATAAMLAAGALHALYITAIGGDYMHGRLLLPAFFALAVPASIAIPPLRAPAAFTNPRTLGVVGVGGLVGIWAIVSVDRVPAATEPAIVPPQPDQRLSRGVGRQAASERHPVRSERQSGRGARTRRACAATSSSPTRPRVRGAIRTRSC